MRERQPARTYYSKVESPYQWSTGETVGTFLTGMRDGPRLVGKRCQVCGKVFCPPQDYCEFCFQPMEEWVEVADRGRIKAWTRMMHYYPGMPCDLPFAYASIQLEGADTCLVHIIRYSDLDSLDVDVEVEAVWKPEDEREGDIRDIAYFRLV